MSGVKAYIYGKSGRPLKINGEGELSVVVHTHPPTDEEVSSIPFREYFRNDSASSNMAVDGSTNSVEFYIEASQEYDIFIKTINVKLAGAGAAFNDFANITGGLGTGIQFSWVSQILGDFIIHDGIKDNLEWFRLSEQSPNIIDLSGGGADAIVPLIDLSKLFGSPWGVKLRKGSTEKLQFIVRDDLSVPQVDEFNIIGYGIQI